MTQNQVAKKVFGFMDEDRKAFLKIKHNEAKRFIDPETGEIFQDMVGRVKCPVCDVDDTVHVFDKAGFKFVKCKQCGLLHVNPQLRPEVQDDIYKSSRTAEQWIKIQSNETEKNWNAEKKYLPALRELAKVYPKGGRLLDVGCSIGQFLNLAKDFGWQGEGIELNEPAADIARSEYGLVIHNKKLHEAGFEDESFDLISLWGVFEHLTDPGEMLQQIYGLLKPGGHALFFVPNGHSLIVRMTREHNSTVSGRAHLWYFTPKTIGQLLNKYSFHKTIEFTILPQLHEIEHFLQYNTLYQESEMECPEEFTIDPNIKPVLEDFLTKKKLGYKMITIARKE